MDYFDCKISEGDPTGSRKPHGFPEPAQKEVISSVLKEKLEFLEKGGKFEPIKLWRPSEEGHPLAGRAFILDGQHRFVAACIKNANIEIKYQKYGTPGFTDGWIRTKRTDKKPAKEVMREQLAKTQARWS